jgi:hypothetical protein
MASASTAFCVVYLSTKDIVEGTYFTRLEPLMKLEHEHQNTHNDTYFYKIYRIYFSYNFRIENSAVKCTVHQLYL